MKETKARENNLSYATPESQGISSESINAFLDNLEQKRLVMHSFMMIRHGKVIAEGYWDFFDENKKNRMYSISKSFTSVAIGMMIDEKKISLNDKVVDFFPEYMPENPHKHMLEATIRDLLMMSSYAYCLDYGRGSDWVELYFKDNGMKHKPGTVFSYDTGATVVLCAIIEKLSGKPMLEYMKPVLDEIGISEDITCIKSPCGRSWTGSGILCTTRDLARFAVLCMNKGEWNGKQLVSREYMEAATSKQIDNSIETTIEFQYGYGYQFWRLRNNGFACYGMGGQFALCMPDQDLILITTADTQAITDGTEHIVDIFHRFVNSINKDDRVMPENKEAQDVLQKRITALKLPLPQGCKKTEKAKSYSGKRYIMEKNPMELKWVSMDITSEKCVLYYENNAGEHTITFGMGEYNRQKFPEKYHGIQIGKKDKNYDTIASGAWSDENTFLGIVYAIDDYLGTIKMQFTFSEDNLCVYMIKVAEFFFDNYQGFATGHA